MDVENLAKELILKNMTPEQQMAVLDSVRQSVAQAKEVQKRKIGENVDLVVQALKKIESDIRSRFDDVGNAIEKRVSTIKDGRDGINGKDGRDGKDGRNGKDGAKGDRGERGQDGVDGSNGVDGVSVTSARIDFDGSLIITLSSGVELNVGEVVAPDLAESIKVITNGGGTSQYVLDTLASLQTQIDNLIPSQTGNSGKYLTTNGTALSWASIAGGGLSYQGTWNASTNTPTLASSTGVNGYYYITATAGSTNLDGITDWQIGDWLLFNGTVWQKIDQSNLVTSVNGQTGAVSVGTVTSVAATAGTGITVTGSPITSSGTLTITNTAPDQTVALTGAGTTSISGTYPNFTITSNDAYVGTVTSVTGTSPVASSGGATPAISLASGYGDTQNPYASKTANYVLAAPNGSAGVPTFRAIVAADIPTLNQNTTGTASNVTGIVDVANGGTNSTATPTSGGVGYGTGTAHAYSAAGTAGQVLTSNGSSAPTWATASGDTIGFKNRIINGAMVIDQRNAGASQTPTNGAYMLDRYAINVSQTSKLTQQQNAGAVTPPAGFTKYMGFTSSSAYSVLTGDYFAFYQAIEGLNVADFAWGTASAATVTLSFWVRSSLTGAFGGSLRNGTADRSYPFSYTINAANTWEQKSVTIAGDTSGTWSTDNGVGILVGFSLGTGSTFNGTVNTWGAGNFIQPSGSTSVVGTSGATFYITGVQLEKGSTATSFDYRPYGAELMLCERYALLLGDGLQGQARTTTDTFLCPFFQQPMRATPTVTMTDTSVQISDNFSANFTSTGSTASQVDMTAYGGRISISGFTGLTLGRTYCAFDNTNGSVMLLSAEL